MRRAESPRLTQRVLIPSQNFIRIGLSRGVEGEREYVDLELQREMDLSEVLGSLQEQLPPGIRILEGLVIDSGSKALMAVLNAALYRIGSQWLCLSRLSVWLRP